MTTLEQAELIRSALRSVTEKRDATQEEVKALASAYLELESVITWDTTCGKCARLLDKSYGSYRDGFAAGERHARFGTKK